jgi:hypothetical protein
VHEQRIWTSYPPNLSVERPKKVGTAMDIANGKNLSRRLGRRFVPVPGLNPDRAEIGHSFKTPVSFWRLPPHLTDARCYLSHELLAR